MTNTRSAIQWTDATWNPVTGCAKVSPGCAHCYAETVAERFWAAQYPLVDTPVQRFRRFTDVQCHGDRLNEPLRWRTPRRVFVNSMSDLFHEAVPDAFIDRVFAVMALCPQHTFQVLTKRADRMADLVPRLAEHHRPLNGSNWPLPNVWLGVSVEDQQHADERIPPLLQTPAAIRFISYEPALGPVEFTGLGLELFASDDAAEAITAGPEAQPGVHDVEKTAANKMPVAGRGVPFNGGDHLAIIPRIDWVIVGGESGSKARPCDVDWIRSAVQQCRAAAVPCFVKQLGARPNCGSCLDRSVCWCGDQLRNVKDRKGGDPAEWPSDLQVREYPATRGSGN